MKRLVSLLLITFVMSFCVQAQQDSTLLLHTSTGNIEGSLLVPDNQMPVPVVLIIAGSGPTDRNGNNPVMKNNALKMLATALYQKGIASLRYDKRGIGASRAAGINESQLRFENYIQDAIAWVHLLKQSKSFGKVIIVGHSEGSLIGMVAAQEKSVDQFISLAGAGQPADQLIREQLKSQPAFVLQQASPILDQLVKGETVDSIPPYLNALFRPSVQPYLISWFQYNPQTEIAKLKKPVLIIQGTTDIQVSVNDAKALKAANQSAKLVLIPGMNHILKNAPADRQQNIQTYSQPDLPLNKKLISTMVDFIKN
jgi:alpha-beta hydrolase superfamily lysophospholipase